MKLLHACNAAISINLEAADAAGEELDLVKGTSRPVAIDYAISNGFGFGGVNASVVFKRWTAVR